MNAITINILVAAAFALVRIAGCKSELFKGMYFGGLFAWSSLSIAKIMLTVAMKPQ